MNSEKHKIRNAKKVERLRQKQRIHENSYLKSELKSALKRFRVKPKIEEEQHKTTKMSLSRTLKTMKSTQSNQKTEESKPPVTTDRSIELDIFHSGPIKRRRHSKLLAKNLAKKLKKDELISYARHYPAISKKKQNNTKMNSNSIF